MFGAPPVHFFNLVVPVWKTSEQYKQPAAERGRLLRLRSRLLCRFFPASPKRNTPIFTVLDLMEHTLLVLTVFKKNTVKSITDHPGLGTSLHQHDQGCRSGLQQKV